MKDDDVKKKDAEQERNSAKSPSTGGATSSDVKAAGTGSDEATGTSIPKAGDHEMGVGGASGETDEGTGPGSSGKTQDPRKNFGVSGQDLTRGGLPPS